MLGHFKCDDCGTVKPIRESQGRGEVYLICPGCGNDVSWVAVCDTDQREFPFVQSSQREGLIPAATQH